MHIRVAIGTGYEGKSYVMIGVMCRLVSFGQASWMEILQTRQLFLLLNQRRLFQ